MRKGYLGMTMDPSLWQMVPGHILCTHSSLSSGSLALPDCGDRELVLLRARSHVTAWDSVLLFSSVRCSLHSQAVSGARKAQH